MSEVSDNNMEIILQETFLLNNTTSSLSPGTQVLFKGKSRSEISRALTSTFRWQSRGCPKGLRCRTALQLQPEAIN